MKPVPGKIQLGHDWTDHPDLAAAAATGKYDGGLVYDDSGSRLRGGIEGKCIEWHPLSQEIADELTEQVQAFCDELQANIVRLSALADGRYDRLPNGESMMLPAAAAAAIARRYRGTVGEYLTGDNPEAERKGQHGHHSFAMVGPGERRGVRRILVDFHAKCEKPGEQWVFDREKSEDRQKIERLYGADPLWEIYAAQYGKHCEVFHSILPAKGVPVEFYDADDFVLVARLDAFPEKAIELTSANDPNWKIGLARNEARNLGVTRGTETGDVIVCDSIPYAVLPDGKAKMVPTKEMHKLAKEVVALEKRMADLLPNHTEEESSAQTL